MITYFFGCWNAPGHYLHHPGGLMVKRESQITQFGPQRINIDGTLAPVHDRGGGISWGAQFSDERERQRHYYGTGGTRRVGEFLLHHLPNGFTAISWWDNSQGDKRPGCNSTFLMEGTHDAAAMLAAFCRDFPSVGANLERDGVKLVQVVP